MMWYGPCGFPFFPTNLKPRGCHELNGKTPFLFESGVLSFCRWEEEPKSGTMWSCRRGFAPGTLPKALKSEIEWAFRLFDGQAFNRMSIDHGGSYIGVSQQLLNSTDVIVCLQ